MRRKIFCPNCGHQIRGKFCGNCGTIVPLKRLLTKGLPVYLGDTYVGTVQQKGTKYFVVRTKDEQILNLKFDQIDYCTDKVFLKPGIETIQQQSTLHPLDIHDKWRSSSILEKSRCRICNAIVGSGEQLCIECQAKEARIQPKLSLDVEESELPLETVESKSPLEILESAPNQSGIEKTDKEALLTLKDPIRPSLGTKETLVEENKVQNQESALITSIPKEKKVTSISEEHKKAFEAIRYNFSEVNFLEESKISSKPLFGALKNIIWDLGAISGKILFIGDGELFTSKDIQIDLLYTGAVKEFDWLSPFEGIEVNATPETTKEALLQERGIPERLIKMGGDVSIEIKTAPHLTVKIIMDDDPHSIEKVWNLAKDLVYFVDLR